MNKDVEKMRDLLTKFKLRADELFNEFDTETLVLMGNASVTLIKLLECDKELLTSAHVKAMVMDDIASVEYNLRVITSTIKFKALQLEGFCMN
jgi:hypothetical protein